MTCVQCSAPLSGRQRRFCSRLCKNRDAVRVRSSKEGYAEKHREEEKARYHRDPARYAGEHRARLYGVTAGEYQRMLSEQGGVCAVCLKLETAVYRGKVKALSVDHDHLTDRVRGLLCAACNRMLGQAYDDPDILEAGAAYLRERREEGVSLEAAMDVLGSAAVEDGHPASRARATIKAAYRRERR